jgi:hypothetical protein
MLADWDTWKMHMQGLKEIVSIRGGLERAFIGMEGVRLMMFLSVILTAFFFSMTNQDAASILWDHLRQTALHIFHHHTTSSLRYNGRLCPQTINQWPGSCQCSGERLSLTNAMSQIFWMTLSLSVRAWS